MENSKLTRVIALFLSVLMVSGLFLSVGAANVTLTSGSKKEEETSVANEALEILGDAKWSEYKEKFGSQPNDRFEALAQEFNIRKIPVLNAD